MSTVFKPVHLKTLEARIVTQKYLYSGKSVNSRFFFQPHTNTNSTTARSEIPLIYGGGSTGGAAAAVSFARMASSGVSDGDDRISRISSTIRVIPDFPKPGIMFQDITTLLLDPKAFKDTIDLFVERYKDKNISVVAGEVISEEYSLEYGTDTMEMHVGAVQPGERAIVVDDLIATGGTLAAAIRLLERVGVDVVECACVIELAGLKGRDRLGDKQVFVLVSS